MAVGIAVYLLDSRYHLANRSLIFQRAWEGGSETQMRDALEYNGFCATPRRYIERRVPHRPAS